MWLYGAQLGQFSLFVCFQDPNLAKEHDIYPVLYSPELWCVMLTLPLLS